MAKRRLARTTPSGKEKRRAKSRWTTWAVVGGLAVAIGVVIAVVAFQSGSKVGPGASGTAHVGSPAPDFTLRLFNGESITLSSLKGKPVLLNFWASG
jgi:cytochrome c biogenesis protein CcmG/thiol:disulfide interchange protein DsbE